MSTFKRVSGDYQIDTVPLVPDNPETRGNVFINTHTLTVNGNLAITGSTSEVEVSQTTIIDPIITLGKGNTGALIHLGIEVVKSPGFKAGLRWNSQAEHWEISPDNTNWSPIATTDAEFRLVDDPEPTLGADLNTNGFNLFSPPGSNITLLPGSNTVEISNTLKIPHRISNPAAESDYTKVYAKEVAGGGSGLYVTTIAPDLSPVQDELVSRAKAIIYSIIF